MHRAVTLGSVMWMGITTRMRPQDGEYHIYGRKMARFRRELQPLLKEARLLDDAWLAPVPDFCYAACWQLADGRGMVVAANDTGAPCMLTVHGTAADGACTVKAPDGDAPGVRRDGDALLLALQPGQICGVLFDR